MPRTCESPLPTPSSLSSWPPLLIYLLPHSIRKLSENCGKEWEEHWQCLEKHNQELYMCRKPERTLNQCVFDKLVSHSAPPAKENTTICFCSVLTRLAAVSFLSYRNWPRRFLARQKASRKSTKRKTLSGAVSSDRQSHPHPHTPLSPVRSGSLAVHPVSCTHCSHPHAVNSFGGQARVAAVALASHAIKKSVETRTCISLRPESVWKSVLCRNVDPTFEPCRRRWMIVQVRAILGQEDKILQER